MYVCPPLPFYTSHCLLLSAEVHLCGYVFSKQFPQRPDILESVNSVAKHLASCFHFVFPNHNGFYDCIIQQMANYCNIALYLSTTLCIAKGRTMFALTVKFSNCDVFIFSASLLLICRNSFKQV